MNIFTPYRAESYDPLRIRDIRTGRYITTTTARAWCDTHGHRWGDLWPDDAWLAADAEKRRAWLDTDRLAPRELAPSPESAIVEYYEETGPETLRTFTLRSDVVRKIARWIPATPAPRWTCEVCGLDVFKGDAETPEEALRRPDPFLAGQIRGMLFRDKRIAEEALLFKEGVQ